MNRSIIRYLVGKILQVEALLLLLPIIVSFLYQESLKQKLSYILVAILIAIISRLFLSRKPEILKIRARDGLITVALSWILLSFFGALPLVLSGEIPNIADAFFEISSGFTTTGSSILSDLSILHHSTLFWRSFTHLVGGMGVLVFTLAILPTSDSDSIQLMRAEVPGPVFGKLVSKLVVSARILYAIYLGMTMILILILFFIKVPLFDSILLAFGTAGTGGFAINNAGFAIYQYPKLVEWVIGIGMLVFGINFNLYYFLLIGYVKDVLKDEELRWFLIIIAIAVAAITFNLLLYADNIFDLVRNVFFTVVSLVTTTGYSTADFNTWPLFSKVILVLLMFVGGCAGSTAGGLKVSRIGMYIKSSIAELKRMGHSRLVIVPHFSKKPIPAKVESQISHYLLVYILFFIVLLISVSFESQDFTTAFTSVASIINNIGPGLNQVGPTQNFGFYSDINKIILSLGMIAGRLEIYPIIILFSPLTLKRLFRFKKKKL